VTQPAPFTLSIGVFDGPLDLLLQLTERRELDITTVSLAQVADLYLAYVRSLEAIDPYDLADFIAVAAKLLLIKSTVLLPRPPRRLEDDEVEDPTDLTERLREYQAIKRAAVELREREEAGLRSYPRLAPLAPPPIPPRREVGVPSDLIRAFERLARLAIERQPEEVVAREPFSISEKMTLLRERTGRGERLSFLALLGGRSRGEIVATFLAVLELIRLGEIDVRQDDRFGDIAIGPAGAVAPN
jgi:segregation and condensation protein A